MSKYTYNKDYFEVIDNQEKAYWLGMLYADGCITKFYRNEKVKSMSLELTLKSEDKPHLEKFLNALESNSPIQNRKHKIGNKTYTSNRVVINCTKMCRDLIDKGCTPQKSLTLAFPTDEQVPKELLPHFMRGYLDGDGCIHYSESMQYHSQKEKSYLSKNFVVSLVGTKKFLRAFKMNLLSNKVFSNTMVQGNTGKAYELRITDRNNLKAMYEYLYKDSIVHLDRKVEVFKHAFERFNIA